MTITKDEATEILGRLTDREIEEWINHLRMPKGYHQCHGSWMEAEGDDWGMCCLTVFATQIGHIEIDEAGFAEVEIPDYPGEPHYDEWTDVADSILERRWGLDTTPFVARNDNVPQDDRQGRYLKPSEIKWDREHVEARPWTFAEIADYLQELQEARNAR